MAADEEGSVDLESSSLHFLFELPTEAVMDDFRSGSEGIDAKDRQSNSARGGGGRQPGSLGNATYATGGRNKCDDDHSNDKDSISIVRYDRHKPKWWKQRVGRYVTKPQRRALETMQAYRLSKPPHGQLLDLDGAFANASDSEGTAGEATRKRRPWMEIGFGKGDNLLCLAQRNPDVRFVGVEVHPSSIAICLQRMQASMERRQFWREYQLYSECLDPFDSSIGTVDASRLEGTVIEPSSSLPYQNVRTYGGDGIVLLENCLPPGSLDAILITFPDPFPSDKPHRILQVHTVSTMFESLSDRGRLYLATDCQGFYEWSLRTVDSWNTIQQQGQSVQSSVKKLVPIQNVNRSQWLPVVSRYERKGWDEGRRTLLACWEKSCGDRFNTDC